MDKFNIKDVIKIVTSDPMGDPYTTNDFSKDFKEMWCNMTKSKKLDFALEQIHNDIPNSYLKDLNSNAMIKSAQGIVDCFNSLCFI